MASPSTVTSSGSSQLQSSGPEEDLRTVMDLRKRKRMISNRESARRSRMRKQQHLDDLMAQVNRLRSENGRVMATLSATTQRCLAVEAENSVLRTQMVELSSRLRSLDEILHCLNGQSINDHHAMAASAGGLVLCDGPQIISEPFVNPLNFAQHVNYHPIMASADVNMFQY